MSGKTGIEWTDATWNPVTGCSRVSPGCAHCYAETLALTRLAGKAGYPGLPWTPANAEANVVLRPERLEVPRHWRARRRVFVNSMSDLFHEQVPDGFLMRVWRVMLEESRHTFQVLTKRPERMRDFVARWMDLSGEDFGFRGARGPEAVRAAHPSGRGQLFAAMLESMGPPPEGMAYPTFDWMEGMLRWPRRPAHNVWLGTSIENDRWTGRADGLRETPAAVRFLSLEPLLGPLPSLDLTGIGWVIVGGESGPGFRPMDPAWVREIRDRCVAAGVPFLFKQWGGNRPKAGGRELDGRTWDQCPEVPA